MQLTKRRKNSIFTFVIRLGGVAQLVERLNGIQEVRGSTPLISTTYKKTNPITVGFFFFFGGSARRYRAACGVNPFGLALRLCDIPGTPRDTVYPWGKGAHKQKSEHYRPR